MKLKNFEEKRVYKKLVTILDDHMSNSTREAMLGILNSVQLERDALQIRKSPGWAISMDGNTISGKCMLSLMVKFSTYCVPSLQYVPVYPHISVIYKKQDLEG